MTLEFFLPMVALIELFFVIATIAASRFVVAVRGYFFASLCLVLLTVLFGMIGESHELYALALFVGFVKCLMIPLWLLREVEHLSLGRRLPSLLRTTAVRIIGVVVALSIVVLGNFLPGLATSASGLMLIVASSTAFVLGFIGMILSRSIPSQIIAFLTIENGLALLFLIIGRPLSPFIELGFLLTTFVALYLMCTLWRETKRVVETDETSQLTSLAE